MGRSSSSSTPRTPARRSASRDPGYADLSRRPLHILAFLSPLILAYEFGSLTYLLDRNGVGEVVAAQQLIERVFNVFGAFGLYLPGLALVAVLLVWHALRRDPWTIHPRVLAGMLGESILWTLPLLVLNGLTTAAVFAQTAFLPHDPWPWQAKLTIALGAGIYEELLFRMIAIAIVHLLVVDVLRQPDRAGRVIAAVASAVLFALYHDPVRAGGFQPGPFVVYFLSGLYFAGVYLLRGFGTVVAVHALYDVAVLLVLNPDAL